MWTLGDKAEFGPVFATPRRLQESSDYIYYSDENSLAYDCELAEINCNRFGYISHTHSLDFGLQDVGSRLHLANLPSYLAKGLHSSKDPLVAKKIRYKPFSLLRMHL